METGRHHGRGTTGHEVHGRLPHHRSQIHQPRTPGRVQGEVVAAGFACISDEVPAHGHLTLEVRMRGAQADRAHGVEVATSTMAERRVQFLGNHATADRDLAGGNQLEQCQGIDRRISGKGVVEQSQRQPPHLLNSKIAARQRDRA